MTQTLNGVLLIDKPVGASSYDVIRRLKALLSTCDLSIPKLGHAGALDPLASGLLVVLIGDATKRQDEFMSMNKEYLADIKLGAISSTDDAEGIIESTAKDQESKKPAKMQIKEALKGFEGQIEQVPPIHSAIKINGRRAYELARRGHDVTLKPRSIYVYQIELVKYRYPDLKIKLKVSSGTYVRALARDMGRVLATGAYLKTLRRVSIGRFTLSQSLKLKDLSSQSLTRRLIRL